MAVLITGASGFLGAYLIQDFLDAGHEVAAFDYADPKPEVTERFGGVRFITGDIRDLDAVTSVVKDTGGDPVVHLAGILTTGCDRDPGQAIAVNVGGTRNIIDAAVAAGNRPVVLASSISVYGRGLPQPIDESMSTEPEGWYGLSKVMAEEIGFLYIRRHGLDFRAVRLAAVTGPGRSAASGSASLFTSFIPEKAALGEPYNIEVDENAAYPVVYVKDAARAIFMLASADTAPRCIYNIASGRIITSELVASVKKRIPKAQFTYKPDEMVMAVVDSYRDWHISCIAAEEDLGWRPAYTVDQMVDDIIEAARARS